MKKLLAVCSGLVALTSSFFVAAAIGDLLTGSDTSTGVLVGMLVFFGGISAGAGYGAVRLWRTPRFDPVSAEPALLALAREQQGRITVAEAALTLKVPLARAKEALDHLVAHGAAQLLVSEGGELVYAVGGFLSAREKDAALDVLSDRPQAPAQELEELAAEAERRR